MCNVLQRLGVIESSPPSEMAQAARQIDSIQTYLDAQKLGFVKHHLTAASSPTALDITLETTPDIPSPTGNHNGGLLLERNTEDHQEDNSQPGKKRRTFRSNDVPSFVAERKSTASDDKQCGTGPTKLHRGTAPMTSKNQLHSDASAPIFSSTRQHTGQASRDLQPTDSLRDRHHAALDVMEYLEETEKIQDLLRGDPDKCDRFFDAVRHALEKCFESRPHIVIPYGLRSRSDKAGAIHLIVVPLIRGDTRPYSLANKYILPGPEGSDIMVKICPALVVSNDQRDNILYKALTTKHKSNHRALYVQEGLKDNFVQMRRPPEALASGYSYLNFITSDSNFDWHEDPSYIPIVGDYQYPRSAPRRYLGKLAAEEDFDELYKILQLEFRKKSAGVLRGLRDSAPPMRNAALSQVIMLAFHMKHPLTNVA